MGLPNAARFCPDCGTDQSWDEEEEEESSFTLPSVQEARAEFYRDLIPREFLNELVHTLRPVAEDFTPDEGAIADAVALQIGEEHGPVQALQRLTEHAGAAKRRMVWGYIGVALSLLLLPIAIVLGYQTGAVAGTGALVFLVAVVLFFVSRRVARNARKQFKFTARATYKIATDLLTE